MYQRSMTNEADCKARDPASGLNMLESFASCDLDTFSLRTSQPCLLPEWIESSVTLPPAGMMRSGKLFERPPLDNRPDVKGFSLLPTPCASDFRRHKFSLETIYKVYTRPIRYGMLLPYVLTIWNIPIPRFPNIYEWIMGFPLNFLKLKQQSKDTETPSALPSQSGSESES